MLSYLTPLVNGGYSAIYKVDEEANNEKGELVLYGTYAGANRKNLSNRFVFGEGLVGQCALECQPITITNAPSDYVTILSGTGESLPMSISVFPIMLEERVTAVLEVASFSTFTEVQSALIDHCLKIIALYFDNLNKKLVTEALLQKSQQIGDLIH